MIDIHLHILPGVDDGPRGFDEAVAMCQAAKVDGCEALIATPHVRHGRWPHSSPNSFDSLLDELRRRVGPEPRLVPGSEIRIDSDLLSDLKDARASTVRPLADSKYLLLEFSRSGVGPSPEYLMHEILLLGWRPVLAHPEFIPQLSADFALIRRLAEMGVLFQVTAMSLTGDFGRRLRRLCCDLLDEGLVHFVASDAHDLAGRPIGLSRAYTEIVRQWGERSADHLTRLNPRAILDNRSIEQLTLTADQT